MSKTMLTQADVPKYIREIVSRLHQTTDYADNDLPGSTFKLYGKWTVGYANQLSSDCEKLLNWCKRWHADAYIVSEHFWMTDVPNTPGYFSPGNKWHRRKAYRDGFRNYIKVVITDPVAHRFEKDGYYRERQIEAKADLNTQIHQAEQRGGVRDSWQSHSKENPER